MTTTPPALLIAGHGTSDTDGAEQFRAFTERVGKRLAPRGVTVGGGFIELSPPPLGEAVAELVAGGHRRLAAVPLMLVAAGHAKGDIPAALAREQLRHPGLAVSYGRPLGAHPTVLALLRERLAQAEAAPPDSDQSVTVLLVGRGSTDPDANADVARAARLLAETARVGGVEYAFVSLASPGVPAGLDRCAALGARRIVVLPYFLFTGVLPRRVAEQAAAWAAGRPDVDVRCADVLGDTDALADLVIERYGEALAGDIRMNCDSCVYRVSLPGFEDRVGAPQTPHHHPGDAGHSHDHSHEHGHSHDHGVLHADIHHRHP
ncbi:sirohydrochlorin chelatase [Catellatospora paridis]|uniref:sirohydrochlorin chelatase n=1 Tax=Catellatospora paridis TaxID=1617086 RepID=UPI0012D4539C|nr:sirohydrochlorin chelatase [Catellatospora paridis]